MPNDSDERLKLLEIKQTEQTITIEKLLFVVDDMKKSVDEIKSYMKNAVASVVITSATLIIGGLGTLVWYGLRAAMRS